MKLGIHTHAWGGHFGGDTLYIIDRCKQLGMDFIEFPLMEIDAFDPVAVKARLEGAIEPTCSTIIPDPHWDIGSEDPACRQLGIDFLKGCIDKTRDVGATVFSGMCYCLPSKQVPPGYDPRAERSRCAAAVKEIARYAAQFGITVGIEPASRFSNHLVNTTGQGLDFLAEVDEPNTILHLDSFHMCYEERDFYKAVVAAGDKLGYFHMCGNDRGRPGYDDIIDWDGVFHGFLQVGFNGYLGFEGFDTTCKYIYRDIIGAPDDFARQSMAFADEMLKKYGYTRG